MTSLRAVLICSALVLGCSPQTSGPRVRDGGGSGNDGSTAGRDSGGGGGSDSGIPNIRECASVQSMAMTGNAPIDIIWVIDNSGSMDNERDAVQTNLNSLSTALDRSALDYHVVMMTNAGFVSVPPPLGTSPRYRYIAQDVQSHDAFDRLLERLPDMRAGGFLRDRAILHVVIVTDDEATGVNGTQFQQMFRAMIGKDFVLHAIVSQDCTTARGTMYCPTSGFPFPMAACQSTAGFPPDGAAAPGKEYIKVQRATGGVFFSICTQDWRPLFNTLTQVIAVAQTIPCVYTLPAPPPGEELDPNKVNVVYTPGDGSGQQLLPRVPSAGDCGASNGFGWYYDQPSMPRTINLCQGACDTVEVDQTGAVDIALGCGTFIL